jgi:hypothetical protein
MAKDKNYWDNKWPKAPIIYGGRVLRVGTERVGVDVRNFITPHDVMLQEIVRKYRLDRGDLNQRAHAVQKFVVKFLTYKYDDESQNCPEFWQFPFETLHSEIGDCEDGAILISSLCRAAGVPDWRVKVAAGYVQESPTAPQGGHGYAIYLADRKDSSRGQEWVVLDWCYYQDSALAIEDKALAKNGGYKGCYKDTWFTFNDEFSWNQTSLKIGRGRVSAHQTMQMNEAVEQEDLLEKVMASIAKRV